MSRSRCQGAERLAIIDKCHKLSYQKTIITLIYPTHSAWALLGAHQVTNSSISPFYNNIEGEVPMNEDWYMVGIVVDVLCELMWSSYFVDHVNISWSTSCTIPGSWLSCHLAHLVRLTNRLSLDLGRMSCSRALFGVSEEVNNSYTSINDNGKNLNN